MTIRDTLQDGPHSFAIDGVVFEFDAAGLLVPTPEQLAVIGRTDARRARFAEATTPTSEPIHRPTEKAVEGAPAYVPEIDEAPVFTPRPRKRRGGAE